MVSAFISQQAATTTQTASQAAVQLPSLHTHWDTPGNWLGIVNQPFAAHPHRAGHVPRRNLTIRGIGGIIGQYWMLLAEMNNQKAQ